ncbi:MAG: hypothetical protein P9M03_11225 [Candidatus Theseobacter exili]|nr:hypothetical protein [Candidatus Theseobacter exili]
MAMRETINSLRAYFIVVAIFKGLSVKTLFDVPSTITWITGIIVVLLALGYFVIGIKLEYFIKQNVKYVFLLLIVAAILVVLVFTANVIINNTRGIVFSFIECAIILYLFNNVKRLSSEEKKLGEIREQE